MPLLRITNGFDKLSDADFEVRANTILTSMTANANFPTPVPALPTVQTSITDYVDALAVAKGGSNYDKAIKNDKKVKLIDVLHSLGNYVLFTANGDELIAKSSGYAIAKMPAPAPDISKAENLKLEDGMNAGELQLSFSKVQGARSYIYQNAKDPVVDESSWANQTGTLRKTLFTGLESQKKYWCRVIAIGINGQQVISDPIARVVQ